MNISKENYSEFIKDEYELEFILGLEEELERVNLLLDILKNHLEHKKSMGDILNYSIQENKLEIDAPRYTIFLLVLHNGDVCQYTNNKKNKTNANYSRRMTYQSALDTLDKYTG